MYSLKTQRIFGNSADGFLNSLVPRYSLQLHIFLVLLATIKVRSLAELISMALVLASSLYTWLSQSTSDLWSVVCDQSFQAGAGFPRKQVDGLLLAQDSKPTPRPAL